MKFQSKTKLGVEITLIPTEYGVTLDFLHPKTKKRILTRGYEYTEDKGVSSQAGFVSIPKEDWEKAEAESKNLKTISETNRKEEEERYYKLVWEWANANNPLQNDLIPCVINPGISDYLNTWKLETGEEFRPNYQYCHTEVYNSPYVQSVLYVKKEYIEQQQEMKKQKEDQEKEKEKKREEENKQKEEEMKAIFSIAKETGKEQLLYSYTWDCDGSTDECSLDNISIFALPNGSTRKSRTHCH